MGSSSPKRDEQKNIFETSTEILIVPHNNAKDEPENEPETA